ncbi:MAG: InlB B-repeat-containing protein [Burkholderiales bacterium]
MIKKSLSLIVVAAMLISLFPVPAFAAGGTIDADGTYDIGSYGNDSVITIEDGLTVTLTNTGGLTFTNVRIICGYGTALTIDGVKIDNSAYDGACALSFTQYRNKLILMGDSYIKSGNNMPGIKMDSSSKLEITGEGSIEVYGGANAAGIGGAYQSAEMAATISGGTVKSTGGFHGAGIGGGDSNRELMVIINGGSITAQGGEGGAGIGGGYNSTGGVVIEINGGDVNAAGGSGGAGIGGGYNGPGGESYITGDSTVRAIGGQNAAGIGGGQGENGGILDISGGLVLAEGNGGYDIGCGAGRTPNEYDWFKISGKAAVLLKNGASTEPTITHHELKIQDPVTNHTAFGYILPDSWTKAYAYIKTYYDLAYDSNGGEGTLPETVTGHEGAWTTVSDGKGLTKDGDVFYKWNTRPDGIGTDYFPGDSFEFTGDTTLYAIYKTPPNVESVTLNKQSATLNRGESILLTADVKPSDAVYSIAWTSSDESVASVNSSGLVTAVGGGDAVITAAAGGVSASCEIHVNFNVTFDAQNGTENVTVGVVKNSAVPKPQDPVRVGYTFNGWYTEQSCANEWDFGKAVTSDMTLYAGWTPEGCPFAGRGTETSPYLITSADELAQLAALVNSGSADYNIGYYMQTQDIDLSAYPNWTPIGAPDKPFSGTYDGNGKSIADINIDIDYPKEAVYMGLFGYITGATIKNIKLEGGNISISSNYSANAGGLAAYTGSGCLIENCSSSADIHADCVSVICVGGIVGYASNNSDETCIIKNCVNSGTIYGRSSSSANVGGVIGNMEYGVSVSRCANNGNITAMPIPTLGGIAGKANGFGRSLYISQCYNTGDVHAGLTVSKGYLGGIAGFVCNTEIANCFNAGKISEFLDSDEPIVGGIAGYASGDSGINKCYNVGEIVSRQSYGGSIAGYIPDTVAEINDCYYADTTFEDYIGVGYGKTYTAYKKTIDELKLQAAYIGYDFETIWTFAAGYDFPQLIGNPFSVMQHDVVLTADSEMGVVQGSGAYKLFETVTITAFANEHYSFKNWAVDSGGVVLDDALSPTATFVMINHDVAIKAVFEKKKYKLTIQCDEKGYGSEEAYAWGETVSINGMARNGYQFMRWEVVSGDVEISDEFDKFAEITMPKSDVIIKAVFDVNPTDYEYTITDKKVTITKYTGTDSNIIIPHRIDGYTVTAIGERAFSNKAVLTSVEVPDTITSIGSSAFAGCTKLKNIKIGNSVKSIEQSAFSNCENLTGISIPDSVKSIGYGCFSNCISLTDVVLGRSLESIGAVAFDGCSSLTEIIIPDCVVSLEYYCFRSCSKLASVTIGAGVENIDESTFYECTSIKNYYASPQNQHYKSVDGVLYDKDLKTLVQYPSGKMGTYSILEGVTSIRSRAFQNSVFLTGINIPETVNNIGDYAFHTCSSLTYVSLPDSLTVISTGAFGCCTNLLEVRFGAHVTTISDKAFFRCENLKEIDIPGTVSRIGDEAFMECWDLERIYFWGDMPVLGTYPNNNVFIYTDVYYHIDHAGSWEKLVTYGRFNKHMFCLLTLDLKDGSIPVTYRARLNALRLPVPDDPIRDHNTFEYWCADAACTTPWDFDTAVTGDITLYAKWKPKSYTVKFDARGGYPVNTQTFVYGSNITAAPAPERPYYVFTGWYPTPACDTPPVGFPLAVTGDVTLYAGWRPQIYNIHYDLDGGKLSSDNPSSYTVESSTFTLRNPSRTGYTFFGWIGTGLSQPTTSVTVYKGSAGDRWYTACWKVNEYTITFNSKEGSAVPPIIAAYGSLIPEPPQPSRQGYAFAGWYRDSSCKTRWNFGTDVVTGNDTLYAKWQPYSNYLDDVVLSAGTLIRPFSKSTVRYNITLGEHESGVTITPIKEYDGAVMKINNVVRDSYSVSLASGKSATVKVAVSYNRKTKTYVFIITRAKSSDNTLGALAASAGTFDKPFDPNILNYTLLIDENTKSVTVSGKAAAPAAKISPKSKRLTLKNGQSKTVKITVKAQNGARRTYTVTVIRAASSNANLRTLRTSPGLSPGFSPYTTSYTVTLPAAKKTASISVRPAGYNAAVYIDGAKRSSKKVTLLNGQSVTVHVMVLAQAGNTKDYYITVTRP